MRRVSVSITRSRLVPRGFAAWVPMRRCVLIGQRVVVTERLLAHELCHVHQAEESVWPLAYVTQWLANGMKYTTMPYERQARAAETIPFYLEWATDLIKEHRL